MKKEVAVATYLDNHIKCVYEIRWLINSWRYSKSSDISDIIIFYNPQIAEELMPAQENGLIFIPLLPISRTTNEWGEYHRVNSIWYPTTKEGEILRDYKYTLLSDTDCFLTKSFVGFRPRLATFGINAYASEPAVLQRLIQICRKYGIKQHFINATSGIMAYSKHVIEYSKLRYNVAKKLRDTEFPDGIGAWPGWYAGITNMYSSHVAANMYFGMGYNLGGIDCMSMCEDPISSNDYHIHAFHTYQDFSKLNWYDGKYNETDFSKLNPEIIKDYCLLMAGKKEKLEIEDSTFCSVCA